VPHSYDYEPEQFQFVMTYFMNLSVIHELCRVERRIIDEW